MAGVREAIYQKHPIPACCYRSGLREEVKPRLDEPPYFWVDACDSEWPGNWEVLRGLRLTLKPAIASIPTITGSAWHLSPEADQGVRSFRGRWQTWAGGCRDRPQGPQGPDRLPQNTLACPFTTQSSTIYCRPRRRRDSIQAADLILCLAGDRRTLRSRQHHAGRRRWTGYSATSAGV